MATVKFIIRKSKKNAKGEAPIFAQYTHDSKTALISTGKRIQEKFWDDEKGKVKGKHENATTLNKSFNLLENKILRAATELQDVGQEPIPANVKDKLLEDTKERLPETQLTRSIIFQWKEFVNSKDLAPNTIKNQKNSMEALQVYLLERKKDAITPERFSLTNLMEFEKHLRDERKSPNTIAKYKKNFKSFLKFYVKLGGKLGFNLDDLRYKERPGLKISLTEDELETLNNAKLSGREAEIRDLFVLQCNTGLRISDLKRLDQNIHGNKIKLVSKKTGILVEIPISPTIREILERYDYKLPSIPDQSINEGIKLIVKDVLPDSIIQVKEGNKFVTVPKWKEISSHDAIRTFITISAERGMSVTSIARITGKSVQVLLKHYLSDVQKVAEQEFEKAWGSSPLKIAK